MLWVRIKQVGKGMHSSEVVVSINTIDGGSEELVVDARSIKNNALEVGYPVGAKDKALLVELPRETVRGMWRVWVPKESVTEAVA